jgi:hypothetical protein
MVFIYHKISACLLVSMQEYAYPWYVGIHLQEHTVSQPRIPQYEQSLPWKPQKVYNFKILQGRDNIVTHKTLHLRHATSSVKCLVDVTV